MLRPAMFRYAGLKSQGSFLGRRSFAKVASVVEDNIKERREQSLQGGGERRLAAQHEKGKLSARVDKKTSHRTDVILQIAVAIA